MQFVLMFVLYSAHMAAQQYNELPLINSSKFSPRNPKPVEMHSNKSLSHYQFQS